MKTTTVHLTVPSLIALVAVVNITLLAIAGAIWETSHLWLPHAGRGVHHVAHNAAAASGSPALSSSVEDTMPNADLRRSTATDEDLRRQYLEIVRLARSLSSQVAAREPQSDLPTGNSNDEEASPTIDPRQLPKLPNPFAPMASGAAALMDPLTKAMTDMAGGLSVDLSGTGLFLGVGLGSGAAEGLNLTDQGTIDASAARAIAASGQQATGLNPTIQSAGEGAAATLIGALNVSSLFGGADIGGAVLALGTGIGNGTAMGLGLRAAEMPVTNASADVGIPEIAGLFGLGLSSSIAGSINVTQLAASAAGGAGGANLIAMLPAAASGFGKGLGSGVPVGLGIQPEPAGGMIVAAAATNGQVDAEMVAMNFAFGLTSRLLANGTVSKLGTASAGTGLSLPSIDIGLAAQGLSRGLVQGAGDAVESIGGIEALMNGVARAPVGGLPNTTIPFNDSINGAAVGLGTGLGGQGVLVARQLLAGMSPRAVTVTPARRDIDARSGRLAARQEAAPADPLTGFNLSTIINEQTVSTALQAGVDALTCEGVGGLFGVLLGLSNSGVISVEAANNEQTRSFIKRIVPPGTIRITSSGNSYEVDGQKVVGALDGALTDALGGITINGRPGPMFVAFAVIHILFGMLMALFILPLAMGLESARNIALRLRLTQVLAKADRWVSILWFIVLAPMLVFVFIFGSLLIGTTIHFRSAHAILGITTTLVGYIAVVFHIISVKYLSQPGIELKSFLRHARIIRMVVNQLFLLLAVSTSMLGFSSLSSIALCIPQAFPFGLTLSLGFGLAGLFVIGATLSGLDNYLGWRYLRGRTQPLEKGGRRAASPL